MQVLKIAICGAQGVGKSALCCRLTDRDPETEYISTIGVDLMVKHLPMKMTNIHYWDLAGDKRFDSITIGYIRGISLLLYVYNIKDLSSIHRMLKLHQHYTNCGNNPLAIVVGTHSKNKSYSCEKQGQNFADKLGIPHILVSSKTSDGIKELSTKIVEILALEDIDIPTQELEIQDKCVML